MIGEEIIDEFETVGVRQGCPLSADLFNVAISDLEKVISKVQSGGVSVGKERIRTIAYADDTVIMAESEEMMNGVLKVFAKYLKKKGLKLKARKAKVMRFKIVGGRKKGYNFEYKNKRQR